MSTRKADDNSPLSQHRYLSSSEYAELRGISGTAVAPRAAILDDPALRSLLWFLQAQSLEPGGLKQVARKFLEQNAGRIGTPSMHRFGMKPGQVYTAEQVKIIRKELHGSHELRLRGEVWDIDTYGDEGRFVKIADASSKPLDYEIKASREAPTSYSAQHVIERIRPSVHDFTGFLADLCINPRLAFVRSGARDGGIEDYRRELDCEFPDQDLRVERVELYWFPDIVGALLDYQRSQQETALAEFVLTAIGRKVWDTLDFALSSRRMVIIEGWEGRGKSEATKAWCRTHLGEARFVDLKGVTSKTTVFRAIAKALGIASTYSRTATEMQSRIEDVLERSRLMIVFDEAHYLFNQGARIYTRPELVDWIDTALCNHDVPVGLVSTPQLIKCVKRAETQVGWNWRQFRRRVRRWVQLAEWNTDSDLEAVARKIMPGISQSGIKLAIGYAKMSLKGAPSRDISGLGDVAMEAKLLAVAAGRQTITFEDIARAVNEHLIPSDTGFAERMAEPDKRGRRALQPAVKAPLTGGLAPRAATPLQPPKRLVSGVGCDDFSGSGRRSCSVEPGRALVPA